MKSLSLALSMSMHIHRHTSPHARLIHVAPVRLPVIVSDVVCPGETCSTISRESSCSSIHLSQSSFLRVSRACRSPPQRLADHPRILHHLVTDVSWQWADRPDGVSWSGITSHHFASSPPPSMELSPITESDSAPSALQSSRVGSTLKHSSPVPHPASSYRVTGSPTFTSIARPKLCLPWSTSPSAAGTRVASIHGRCRGSIYVYPIVDTLEDQTASLPHPALTHCRQLPAHFVVCAVVPPEPGD
ncbi:hypothetical protein C8F01DRAFT_36244 [Mycena amicta]|nr:hypothetical protein C8F01DRAFT_36244 [Mycena amicta]